MTNGLPFPNRNFMQVCWLVPDLNKAIESWSRSAGVGPFFWFDGVDCVDGRHRGAPADFPTVTAAIAYAGDLQVELVCQDNDEPGVFRDVFGRGESGLHHMALVCTDYEAERDAYIAGGAELAFEARIGNSRTCWVDTTPTLGFMVELLEPSPVREAGFAAMRAAAQAWDGVNPITRF
ncbi:VOC family protein [Mycolicibacterium confluentis]|uniref:Glyoxalase n=1 Tax=Mycolicibacterium confluentis TaxID=28047 RepID=A0A7I7Y2D8_9MYCO|nr:VOC family protein [Mycolicibacterium confluentis]MCV7320287.1 VOC family protein [Mycolicibacterium confluentis]BBZ35323.1 glyoxalase [Mycolicibacterium confluentis]